ncbi:MAG: hypothetical protein WCN95_08440 [bacterium]
MPVLISERDAGALMMERKELVKKKEENKAGGTEGTAQQPGIQEGNK